MGTFGRFATIYALSRGQKLSPKISLCILTQAFSKDKTSSLFLFSPLKHSLHVSALRPDHMVSDKLLTKIIMDHKTSKLHFYFLQQLARKSESEGQRGVVKISTPQGCPLFLLADLPSPPSSLSSTTPSETLLQLPIFHFESFSSSTRPKN